ncbi:MAG: hypothetical protein ACXW1E_08010 [Halobacteriota archaeon]
MINILSEMQSEFSKIDMQKLDAVYQLIEREKSATLAFAKDPNDFMTQNVGGDYFPSGTHFHIQIDDKEFPSDQIEIANRIVFSRVISLPVGLKSEVIRAIENQSLVSASFGNSEAPVTPGGLCRRCRYCAIAIVSWTN